MGDHWASFHVEASPLTPEVSLLITAGWWTSKPGWIECWFHLEGTEKLIFLPRALNDSHCKNKTWDPPSVPVLFCFFSLLPPSYGLHSLRSGKRGMTVPHVGPRAPFGETCLHIHPWAILREGVGRAGQGLSHVQGRHSPFSWGCA